MKIKSKVSMYILSALLITPLMGLGEISKAEEIDTIDTSDSLIINEAESEGSGNIKGYVWFDKNRNGIRDNDEELMPNVGYHLYKVKDNKQLEKVFRDSKDNKLQYLNTGMPSQTHFGEVNINNLPDGTYVIGFEKSTFKKYLPTKYNIGENTLINSKVKANDNDSMVYTHEFEIRDGNTVDNMNMGLIREDGKGKLKVTVRDSKSGKRIPGAMINLKSKNLKELTGKESVFIQDETGDGVIDLKVLENFKDGLKIGEYEIVSTIVDNNRHRDNYDSIKVVIEEDRETEVEIFLTPNTLNIQTLNLSDSERVFVETRYQIINKKGDIMPLEFKDNTYYYNENSKNNTIITKKGNVDVVGLPYGDYELKVIKVPSGYTQEVEKIMIKNPEDREHTNIEMFFKAKRSAVLVSDALTSKPLTGIAFDISGPSFPDGKVFTTNKEGNIVFPSLKDGLYKYKQLDTKDGYTLNPNEYSLTVKDGFVNITNISVSPTSVYIKNIDSQNGEPVIGSEFTILGNEGVTLRFVYNESYKAYFLENSDNNQVITTDDRGNLKINYLKEGHYKLVETKTADGYNVISRPISFKVSLDNKLTNPSKVIIENNRLKSEIDTDDNSNDNSSDIDDNKDVTSHQTGDMEIMTIVILIVIVIGALIVIYVYKKQDEENNNI